MTHSVRPNLCLNCGHCCDRASQVTERGTRGSEARPTPGAVTVCIRCGHVMVFDQDLRFREPNRAERRWIERDHMLTTIRNLIIEHATPPPKGSPS